MQLDTANSLDGGPPDAPEVSLEDLLPDPYEEPLVAIHEPLQPDGTVSLSKGISRRHIKISYHYPKDCFQLTVLGRNGAFLNGQHYGPSSTVPLTHGSVIQVGGVTIKFHLPSEAIPNGDDQFSSSGHVSHAFEDSEGGHLEAGDSDDFDDVLPEQRFNNNHLHQFYDSDLSDEDSEPAASIENEMPQATKVRLKLKQKSSHLRQQQSGRHVADDGGNKKSKSTGKSSKRPSLFGRKTKGAGRKGPRRQVSLALSDDADEESEEDAAEEPTYVRPTASKKPAKRPAEPSKGLTSPPEMPNHLVSRETEVINGENGVYIPNLPIGVVIPARKKGPGRPPKDGLMSKREKAILNKHLREIEKAKKLGLDPSQVPALDLATNKPNKPRGESRDLSSVVPTLGSIAPPAQGVDQVVNGERSNKSNKEEEPAQPEMKESDYTSEQLMKPQANYATMLYDILKEHGRMNLQQIYEVMERKYPYFKFKAGTSGWQSSVRHNLGQNDVFRKAEKDGKGYSWELNPDKPMEPPRKIKKPGTPPPHPPHGFNPYQQRHYSHVPPYQSGQYPQSRPPMGQGVPLSQGMNDTTTGSGQGPGAHSSPYANNAPHQQHMHGNVPTSSPHNATAAPRPNPIQNSTQHGPRKEPIWTRETLVTTVFKIYGPRLGPSIDLKATCERAVDWFLRPSEMQAQKAQPPFGKELEILKALRDAHNAQQNNADVLANRQNGAAQQAGNIQKTASPNPPASASPASAMQQVVRGPTPTQHPEGQQPQQQQSKQAKSPRAGTPEAPQPEPLTRPNSSHDITRGERSQTPSKIAAPEPTVPAAEVEEPIAKRLKRDRTSITTQESTPKRTRRHP